VTMFTKVEEEFRGRAIVRGGVLLLHPADALELVRTCRERRIEVLGVDGFHLTAITTQPDMGESVDLSGMENLRNPLSCWDRAEAFLAQRAATNLFFDVVVDGTTQGPGRSGTSCLSLENSSIGKREQMNGLTSKQMRGLFYAIEINLILWLVVAGRIWASDIDATTKHMTEVAFLASAVLQHWAYYSLFKKAKAAGTPKQ
jgi:hypothetical protein